MVDAELMDANEKKKQAYYHKLMYIVKGEIRIPGETRSGVTDRPAIGRARVGPFAKDVDLEFTDYFRDFVPNRRKRPHGGSF